MWCYQDIPQPRPRVAVRWVAPHRAWRRLGEKLQQQSRERSTRPELPPTWREQPVRNVVIASYKKNTEGNYHRHNRLDWSAEQGARRDCFHDAAWVEYLAPPRVPEGAVHLIIGDSLVRVLTRYGPIGRQESWVSLELPRHRCWQPWTC